MECFGMIFRKVKKETGARLRLLSWVGRVNGARVTLGDTTKRDRADRRLLYLEDAGSQARDRHDLLED